MPFVTVAARQAARGLVAGVARATGVSCGGHVLRFVAEDARALATYVADRAVREAQTHDASLASTADEWFDFSRQYFGTGPVQNRSEILSLVALAQQNGTSSACEIGAEDAGTSVILSHALALDALIVMDLYVKNRWRLRRAAPGHQEVHTIDGDTHHPVTIARLRRRLRGHKLDLLLIDGDHRWSGVRQDFLTYREFVRHRGLIAFHDICAVHAPDPIAWVGDVPEFWPLVQQLYDSHEFVESSGQQGKGIGVIYYDATRSIAPVLDALGPAR